MGGSAPEQPNDDDQHNGAYRSGQDAGQVDTCVTKFCPNNTWNR